MYNSPTTQTDVTSLICDISKSADSLIPSAAGYSVTSGASSVGTAVGVALSGVLMFNGMSANNVDPFFPSPTSYAAESVDGCLGHP